jgi:hypothetical protein
MIDPVVVLRFLTLFGLPRRLEEDEEDLIEEED